MNRDIVIKIVKSDYVKLIPILVFAFYISLIPNQGSQYPVHIDEWVHMAFSNEIMTEGSIDISDPFDGSPLRMVDKMELGFQAFLGVFQRISGISWNMVVRYLPGVIFILTILSVYIFARKEGFGWEAALMTCFITSNIGIMGPAFLIPVSMALLFIPLFLFLAYYYRTVWSYIIIFISMCFLITIHAPSGICGILILAPYLVLKIRKEPLHSLWLFLALVVPFVASLPVTHGLASSYMQSLFIEKSPLTDHALPKILEDYGYIPITLCLIGTFVLASRGGPKNYGMVGGLLVILVMLATFFTLSYGIGIVYLRGLLFAMLMMGIIGGLALKEIRTLKLPERISKWVKYPVIARYSGAVLCLTVIVLMIVVAVPSRERTLYYHLIDTTDYEAFTWIDDNLGNEYENVILDPWKATALTAITGKHVYTRIHNSPTTASDIAYEFIWDGSASTKFLKENGIGVVYTRVYENSQERNIDYLPENADLVEMYDNVYVLKDSSTQ